MIICHRIISINGTKFYTKGDANENDDSWIQNGFQYDNIEGKVLLKLPQLGVLILAIRETWTGKVCSTVDVIYSPIVSFFRKKSCKYRVGTSFK